jgi:hypothetical protein
MNRFTFAPLILGAAVFFGPILLAPAQEEAGRLVRLSVVATDNHNEPIGDLTQDDFEVSENGKPRKIAYFHKSDSTPETSAAALGPHEFSNRSGVTLPRVTLILLDCLDPRLSEQGRARDQIVKELRSVDSGDDLYFYLLPPFMDLNARIEATYNALAALASRLESIPGRKNIVWITHGVPISVAPRRTVGHTGADLSDVMARLGTVLDRAGVAMYPVI